MLNGVEHEKKFFNLGAWSFLGIFILIFIITSEKNMDIIFDMIVYTLTELSHSE